MKVSSAWKHNLLCSGEQKIPTVSGLKPVDWKESADDLSEKARQPASVQYSAKLWEKIVVKARSKNAKYCQTTPRDAKTDKRVKILFLFAEKKKVWNFQHYKSMEVEL